MGITTKIKDLQTLLKAISIVRQKLVQTINDKFKEIEADHPKMRFSEIQDRVFGSREVMEILQNLNNLYGVLGSESETYITELEDVRDNLKKAG